MRLVLPLALASLGLLLASCQGSSLTPPQPTATSGSLPSSTTLGAALLQGNLAHTALGIYTLTVDPGSLSATSHLQTVRIGMQNDDLYQLSIDNFLRSDSFRVTRVQRTPGTLDLTYEVTHPFPAPADAFGLPNGFSNRADLCIAGQVLFLVDVPSASGNTFFSDRIANTALVANADAYYSPAGLLNLTTTANTFPYLSVVDENGDGSRVGIPNGGDPTGNFGPDGWTRAEFGANNNGWTGFGVLHQGQTSQRTLSLDLPALQAVGATTIEVAILAKYNDPRGGITAAQKRSNRLPPASPDADLFAYRMPHGAIDVEQIAFAGESGGFMPNQISASTLSFQVVDWDARAIETTAPDLSEDLDVTTVAVGESGLPGIAVCIPGVLGDASTVETFDVGTDVLDDDSGFGGDPEPDSGRPGDRLLYQRAVTKTITSGQTAGMYVGLARATDVETGLVVPLDGETLLPLTSNLPEPVTYQAFQVAMGALNAPPTASYVVSTPNVTDGGIAAISVTGLADAEGDDIDILVDWDDNGTYTLATTVMSPYPSSVPVSSPITYTHTPPAPDIRDLPVRISDGTSTVDLLPTQTFAVLAPGICGAPWTSPTTFSTGWPTSTLGTFATAATGVSGVPWAYAAFRVPTLSYPAAGTHAGWVYQQRINTPVFSQHIYRVYGNGPTVADGFTVIPLDNAPGTFGSDSATSRQVHTLDVDTTNRVLFACRQQGQFSTSISTSVNTIYTTGEAAFRYFDTDGGGTPVTDAGITLVATGSVVLALCLDQSDNVVLVDSQHVLRKYTKGTGYTEDTSAPFPIDLKNAPYSIDLTQDISDLDINYHNQAIFVLAETTIGQERIYRIECDGAFQNPVSGGGGANPLNTDLTDFSTQARPYELVIDHYDSTGAVLGDATDAQMFAMGFSGTNGNEFHLFSSQLNRTGGTTWGIGSYLGAIDTLHNWILGRVGTAGTGHRVYGAAPVGWE